MTDPLRLALDDLAYAATGTDDRVARVRRAVRRRRTAHLSAAALVLVLGSGALLALPDEHSRTAVLGGPSPGAYVDCLGAQVYLDRFSAESQEEKAAGLPQDGLRAVLAHPGEVGLSGAGHWVELARTDTVVTYGRRTGDVGIGSVVALEQKPDGTWGFRSSGGCGTVHPSSQLASAVIGGYETRGNTLVLRWSTGSCSPSTVPEDTLVRTEVHEEADGVHVRIVTTHNDAAGAADRPCLGVGREEVANALLSTPLNDRQVWDDSSIPPRRLS